VAGNLGVDAFGLELVGETVQSAREHAEPAAQQHHFRLGSEGAAAPEQCERHGRTEPTRAGDHADGMTSISHAHR
jgi:hypothetical protein